jgi:hypothetical protein
MRITYKPSKWRKLPFISKIGISIFYLAFLSGFAEPLFEIFDIKLFAFPDYWLLICIIIGFLGFFIAAFFDKGGKIERGIYKV